jgi:hypothetical protein
VAFALGHPGFGPQRIAAELARERWGALEVSKNGVWRALRRHGLNTRAKRLALVAGYAAPPAPERPRSRSATSTSTGPASWSAWTASSSAVCAAPDTRLADHRHRRLLLLCLDQPRHLPRRPALRRADLGPGSPRRHPISAAPAGASSGCSATTATSSAPTASPTSSPSSARPGPTSAPDGRRPTGHVENLHKTILDECWRPAFARSLIPAYTALRRDLVEYLDYYNTDRPTPAA